MISEIARWASRFVFYLVLWVFILSIRWEGRTLFDRAHEVIIENPLVELLDEELGILWDRLSDTARTAYAKLQESRHGKSQDSSQ